MGAVRIALFDDKQHRDDVAKALQKNKIKKLLIIGTSEKMAGKITSMSKIKQVLIMHRNGMSNRDDRIQIFEIHRNIENLLLLIKNRRKITTFF